MTSRARPNEADPAICFAEDTQPTSCDPNAAPVFWQQLAQADRLIMQVRSSLMGKVSPAPFIGGSLDLA